MALHVYFKFLKAKYLLLMELANQYLTRSSSKGWSHLRINGKCLWMSSLQLIDTTYKCLGMQTNSKELGVQIYFFTASSNVVYTLEAPSGSFLNVQPQVSYLLTRHPPHRNLSYMHTWSLRSFALLYPTKVRNLDTKIVLPYQGGERAALRSGYEHAWTLEPTSALIPALTLTVYATYTQNCGVRDSTTWVLVKGKCV